MQNNPIIKFFNEIAPTYDLLNHLFSFNTDRYWRKIALHATEFPSDAVVLDLCAGTADMAIAVAKNQRGSHIYGVDLSENMLARAKSKIARDHLEPRIHLLKADALQLPFTEKNFDAIFLSFGLRNLQNRARGIEEMTRVLKQHGSVVILEFSPLPASFWGCLYRFYLGTVIPFVGKIISKSASAYQYLHSSIRQFLQPEEIVKLLENHGLHVTSTRRLMFGIVHLHVARKKRAEQ